MNEALNIARKLKDALDVAFGHPAHAVIMEPVHESEPAHVDIGPYMTADGKMVIVAECNSDGKIGLCKVHPAVIYGSDYDIVADTVTDATTCILAMMPKPAEAPTEAKEIEPTEEQRVAARAWQDGIEQRVSGHPTLALFLAQREHKLRVEIAEYELAAEMDTEEVGAAVADRVERTADIHDLMDKMAVLMEGVAEGWNDGLDNKGSAAFFAVEEAQQVYTRCAARYGTPEVRPSYESGEGEAVGDVAPTIHSTPVVVDASIPEGGPQVMVSRLPAMSREQAEAALKPIVDEAWKPAEAGALRVVVFLNRGCTFDDEVKDD